MIINTETREYKVLRQEEGWSWAVPRVYVRKKIPLLPLSRWVSVWKGRPVAALSARKYLPAEMARWFRAAIKEYENYEQEWRDAV